MSQQSTWPTYLALACLSLLVGCGSSDSSGPGSTDTGTGSSSSSSSSSGGFSSSSGGGSGGSTLNVSSRAVFEPLFGSDTVDVAVTLSPPSPHTVSVHFATADATAHVAIDYLATNGMLFFAPGETVKTFSVTVLSDIPKNENDENFLVMLSAPVNATLGIAQDSVVIVDRLAITDTGITTCGNAVSNAASCPQFGFAQQDAEFGRDANSLTDSSSDGDVGFSYTKLDTNGNALAASASSWSCVRDEVTGLVWEIKTDNAGLRDRDNTFIWYNADPTRNGGNVGATTGGHCTSINPTCNTSAYVQAVNAAGLCGAKNWRMPTAEELLSLAHYGKSTAPGIDTAYFPDVIISGPLIYWAADTQASSPENAWVVNYSVGRDGNSSVASKSSFPALIRLVR